MDSSLRFLGILTCTVAISFCLVTCTFPDLLATKKTAEHCHTEGENQGEPQQETFCCSGVAILPVAQPAYLFLADAQPVIQLAATTIHGFAYGSRSIDFFPDSSPPIRTVLRI